MMRDLLVGEIVRLKEPFEGNNGTYRYGKIEHLPSDEPACHPPEFRVIPVYRYLSRRLRKRYGSYVVMRNTMVYSTLDGYMVEGRFPFTLQLVREGMVALKKAYTISS